MTREEQKAAIRADLARNVGYPKKSRTMNVRLETIAYVDTKKYGGEPFGVALHRLLTGKVLEDGRRHNKGKEGRTWVRKDAGPQD